MSSKRWSDTLILLGSHPENLPRPVVSFLRGANHLADLQFRWVSKKDCPFRILPNSSSFDLSTLFPALTSLTVTNPTSSDHCYAHLPPGLKHLFLPVVCPKDEDENGVGLLLNDARGIIQSIVAGSAVLVTLQFSLQCFTPPEIVRDTAQALPVLQTLVIGTMYNDLSPNTAPGRLRECPLSAPMSAGTQNRTTVEIERPTRLSRSQFRGNESCCVPALQSVALQSLASTGSFLEADRSDT